MNHVLTIALKEFGDRFRSGWVIACALVWLGAIALTSFFGLLQVGKIGVQGYERTVMSLLNLVQYLVPLLGLLVGHDLVVSEREERTLGLMLAGGVTRRRVLLGKFGGGCLTLALPLVLGFSIAGTGILLSVGNAGLAGFIKLAVSGLVLGFVFLAIGLWVSVLSRSRVQALVMALLTWCAAVFVFDLLAMGVLVTTASPQAAREIQTATEATHVNAIADVHAAFEKGDDAAARHAAAQPPQISPWLLLNPVDLFRAINLPRDLVPAVSPVAAAASIGGWLLVALTLANRRLNRMDV